MSQATSIPSTPGASGCDVLVIASGPAGGTVAARRNQARDVGALPGENIAADAG